MNDHLLQAKEFPPPEDVELTEEGLAKLESSLGSGWAERRRLVTEGVTLNKLHKMSKD